MTNSIKDRLKGSQGSGNAIPQLSIVKRISLKEITGEVVFSEYDKDQKCNVEFPAPIVGILIGTAMEATSYSDDLGSKGGNYTSSYYFTNNDQIALFAPTSKGYEVVHKGNMDAIEAYIKTNSTGNLKKRQVLFILTEIGLLAISTNLSISIDQIRQNKEALQERYIVLNPKLFEESDTTISKKAKEYLGKFRQKNPPKFAAISVGDLISEPDFVSMGADEVIEEYKVWKEFKTKGGIEKPKTDGESQTEEEKSFAQTRNIDQPAAHATPIEQAYSGGTKKDGKNYGLASDPSGDLPF